MGVEPRLDPPYGDFVVPIVLLVLFGFLLGVTFAWMARAELGRVDAPIVATSPATIAGATAPPRKPAKV